MTPIVIPEENSEDDDESEDGYSAARMPDASGKNKLLANGYKNGLSYIARGKNIGVCRKTEDDQLEYAATISKVLTPQGKQFAPKKVRTLARHFFRNFSNSLVATNYR